jgi:DNA-binding transcriptional LysR family regulator
LPPGRPATRLLDIRPWRRESLLLLAAPQHELALSVSPLYSEQLSACHWLLREPGSGTRLVSERFWAEHGILPASHSEIASNEAIARMVAAGAGIALLPQVQVLDLLQLGTLVALRLPSVPRVERQLLYPAPARPLPSPALQVFIRRLAASCRP